MTTGYSLTKAFYAELEVNEAMQINCKPHHHSLYTWICELRNRTKREVLDLPVHYTMQMSFIGSQHTLAKAIDDLAGWGIIEVLLQTKGVGTKVKIAFAFLQKHCKSDANEVQIDSKSDANEVQTTKRNKTDKTEEKDKKGDKPDADSKTVDTKVRKNGNGVMIRPTVEELSAFVKLKGGTQTMAEQMHNYFQSKGWKVGKAPMDDWNAAARNWISRERENSGIIPLNGGAKKMVV